MSINLVVNPEAYSPGDVMTASAVATYLRPDLDAKRGLRWVREKVRPRCVSQLPVRNIGRCLIFSELEITRWLQNLEPVRHVAHSPRRKKSEKSAKKAKVA